MRSGVLVARYWELSYLLSLVCKLVNCTAGETMEYVGAKKNLASGGGTHILESRGCGVRSLGASGNLVNVLAGWRYHSPWDLDLERGTLHANT